MTNRAASSHIPGQGAALGHSILWTVLLTYPLMVAIQIAADLIAMGAAINPVVVGPTRIYTVGLALFSLILQVFMPYKRYVQAQTEQGMLLREPINL